MKRRKFLGYVVAPLVAAGAGAKIEFDSITKNPQKRVERMQEYVKYSNEKIVAKWEPILARLDELGQIDKEKVMAAILAHAEPKLQEDAELIFRNTKYPYVTVPFAGIASGVLAAILGIGINSPIFWKDDEIKQGVAHE